MVFFLRKPLGVSQELLFLEFLHWSRPSLFKFGFWMFLMFSMFGVPILRRVAEQVYNWEIDFFYVICKLLVCDSKAYSWTSTSWSMPWPHCAPLANEGSNRPWFWSWFSWMDQSSPTHGPIRGQKLCQVPTPVTRIPETVGKGEVIPGQVWGDPEKWPAAFCFDEYHRATCHKRLHQDTFGAVLGWNNETEGWWAGKALNGVSDIVLSSM